MKRLSTYVLIMTATGVIGLYGSSLYGKDIPIDAYIPFIAMFVIAMFGRLIR